MPRREEDTQRGRAGSTGKGKRQETRDKSLAATLCVEGWRPGDRAACPGSKWAWKDSPWQRTSLGAHVAIGVHPRKQTPL